MPLVQRAPLLHRAQSARLNRGHWLAKGLVSWWLAVPGFIGSTTWRDLCERNNGTLTNMAVPSTSTSGWNAVTRQGGIGALAFDGTDDYVTMGSPTTLDNLSALSYCAWIYPRTQGESLSGMIVTKTTGFDAIKTLALADNVGVNFRAKIECSSEDMSISTAVNTITLNAWQHVVLTFDGTTGILYKNAVNIGSDTAVGTPFSDASNDFIIGNIADGSRTFDGFIDDVRVYNRALSASEVLFLYHNSRIGYPGLLYSACWGRGAFAPLAAAAGQPVGQMMRMGVGR